MKYLNEPDLERFVDSLPSMLKFSQLNLFGLWFVWLTSSAAGQIQQIGSIQTFDVASWNIEWFGSTSNGPVDDASQLQWVAEVIRTSDVDVWALQEISDEPQFSELLTNLGADWDGSLATISGTQRVGFVYKQTVLQNATISHILTGSDFEYSFAYRPPLQLTGTVTLPDTSFSVSLINVHMKAFMDPSSWERRVQASSYVKNYIESEFASSDYVLFLGDFNDGVNSSYYSNYPSPYVNFAWDTSNYVMLTASLEANQAFSYIGQNPGSNIDHMIATDDLGRLLRSDGAVYSSLASIDNFSELVSDHLPVVASFGASTSTAVASWEVVERHELAVSSAFPNPTIGTVWFEVQASTPQQATVSVYDTLGREIYYRPVNIAMGSSRLVVDVPETTPSGTYFYRLSNSTGHYSTGTFVLLN